MVGETMKLSTQAMGSLMMALQKSLMEQSDITEALQKMDFIPGVEGQGDEAELYVKNPPIVKMNDNLVEDEEA
tara:strand:- start:801 stop:1019 length:219 start_codon:yes stop_codon:yes gene_type:complete